MSIESEQILRDELRRARQEIIELKELVAQQKQKKERLQDRVSLFEQAFLSLSDYTYVAAVTTANNLESIYNSPQAKTLTQYEQFDLLANWDFWSKQVVDKNDHPLFLEHLNLLKQGIDSEVEYRIRRADGGRIWVRDRAKVKQQQGSYLVYGVITDITNHQRQQNAMRRLLELSRELVTTHNPNLVLDRTVKAALELAAKADHGSLQLLDEAGKSSRTAATSNPHESLNDTITFRDNVGVAGYALVNNRAINVPDVLIDERFVFGSQPLRFRSLLVAPLTVKGKRLGTLSLSSKEVKAFSKSDEMLVQLIADQVAVAVENARLFDSQHQAWAEANTAAARLQALFDSSVQGFVLIDQNKQVQAFNRVANKHFKTVCGLSLQENSSFYDYILPEHQENFERHIKQAQQKESVSIEYKFTSYLDKEFWLEINYTSVINANDEVMGVCFSTVDISERKQAEAQLRSLKAQFLQSQKMEAIGRLAGSVAHDFNNILTIIESYSMMLADEFNPKSSLYHNVMQIKRASEQATLLIRQLLMFSRQEVTQPKLLNLNKVVDNMLHLLSRLIGENVKLITELSSNLYMVRADVGQLEQVLMNLAVNARDAMAEGGEIRITTQNIDPAEANKRGLEQSHGSRFILLSVVDFGVGMTEQTIEQIFEPFFTTKERGQGTGLGLSTVRSIVLQNHGDIRVMSEPQQGTTIEIYLPAVIDSPDQPPEQSRPAVAAARPPKNGTETILVVEDEPVIRELTERILQKYGYQVLQAPNGVEALRLCEQHVGPIDLLLTDVVMPGNLNSRELAEQVKIKYPQIKILYMSGYTDDVVLRHGISNTDTFFLQKPFQPSTLTKKIRTILDKA